MTLDWADGAESDLAEYVSSTWTTSSPADYVSTTGEVKVKVRATRSLSFRTATDLVRFSVEY